ncbi:Kae1-like domain-containing protein [Pseudorhodoferax sp.]|uniref:Kae1-like domain-containing protein n=1 Tax=Pseudorhodoferax sp. TaxID=1993553 RepID=UPI002DD623E5|nr:carbamoyltransferase HypF [Pseudorhodoferax sp.]
MQPAPPPLTLPRPAPRPVLAMGAFLKNRACLLEHDQVHWSPMHGDLATPEACAALAGSASQLLHRAGRPVAAIAHDLHPDFPSTRLALSLAQQLGVPAHAVQHHHAHLGVVMAEQGCAAQRCPGGPVFGLALDGVGLGSDGTAWGGELLAATAQGFVRLAHLAPLALPGGDAAAREPWRVAASVLQRAGRGDQIMPRLGALAGERLARGVALLLARGSHCPTSSSAGRWFDAAAAALGLAPARQAEAEAAIALEQAATAWLEVHPMPGLPAPTLDLYPLVATLFDEADTGRGAALFHGALAAGLVDAARGAGARHLVLGGGCFHNRLLSRLVAEAAAAAGITTERPRAVDCGDAGLALGQAWLAAHAASDSGAS